MRDLDVVASIEPSGDCGEYTPADLAELPEDVVRVELIDGSLSIRRPPAPAHQSALLELACTLRNACPEELRVLPAPVRFQPATGLSLLPDVLVCHRDDVGPWYIEQPPRLAVAVMSPLSRELDSSFRRALYELSGVRSYWMLDLRKKSLTVLELEAGGYVERAVAVGDEKVEVVSPFRVTVVPGRLIR
jgi:Uma2 family endonuclease